MAQKNNVDQQNSIDKLNANLSSVGEKVVENKKMILSVVGGVVVVAAAVVCFFLFYLNPKQDKAYEALNQVEIKAMGNDSIASAEYAKVADQNRGTNAGKLAALSAAEAYYNRGDYKNALKYLEQFSTSEPVLAANALILTGDCHVNLKAYDKALECYDKAISKADKNPQIAPRVLLKKANIFDEQKKYDKALECYQSIKNDYPQFQIGNGLGIDAYIERENARLGK